jgi:hypothetical protein
MATSCHAPMMTRRLREQRLWQSLGRCAITWISAIFKNRLSQNPRKFFFVEFKVEHENNDESATPGLLSDPLQAEAH